MRDLCGGQTNVYPSPKPRTPTITAGYWLLRHRFDCMTPCLRGAFGADDLSRKLNSFRAPLQDHVLILLQSSFDSGLIADIHPRDDATEFQSIFDSNDSTFAAPCSRQKMS